MGVPSPTSGPTKMVVRRFSLGHRCSTCCVTHARGMHVIVCGCGCGYARAAFGHTSCVSTRRGMCVCVRERETAYERQSVEREDEREGEREAGNRSVTSSNLVQGKSSTYSDAPITCTTSSSPGNLPPPSSLGGAVCDD